MAQKNQEAALKAAAELEIEMMSDMYRRMTKCCQEKCISANYKEADLTKGESVCVDRCVSKFLDLHDRLGKTLTAMTQEDDKQIQAQAQRSAK